MKEQYFSSETINDLSRQWLNAYAWPEKTASQLFDMDSSKLLLFSDPGNDQLLPPNISTLLRMPE